MKALAKLKSEPGIWMTTRSTPSLSCHDVLVKIRKTAICGTDLHIYQWDRWAQQTIPVPMIIGHEFVGEIVAIGKEVKNLTIGDRVSGEVHINCGFCRNCHAGKRHLCPYTKGIGIHCQGAFAEYLAIPASNAFKVPAYISDEVASIFDPFGNAVHTTLSFNLVGEDVLITGAGPIGIMAVAIARHIGARSIVVTDMNEYRLQLATAMGADRVLNFSTDRSSDAQVARLKQTMRELNITLGFDVGMEMSGHQQAIGNLIQTMHHGGHVALLGIAHDAIRVAWNDIVFKGLHLKGIYGREIYETWYKMVNMIGNGLDISAVITHQFSADDYLKGFELIQSGQCGKVVLNW